MDTIEFRPKSAETIHIDYEGIPLADVETDRVRTGVDAEKGIIETGLRPADRDELLSYLLNYADLIRWDKWLMLYDVYLHPAVEKDDASCIGELCDSRAGRVNLAAAMMEPMRISIPPRRLADYRDESIVGGAVMT